jgi:alpha-tubulin suppressor-like RCC1 family protein
VTAVSAGAFHACALTADGTAWCWGANYVGQLGRGVSGGKFSPGRVVHPVKFSQIVAQWRHTCGLDVNGVVWCWGLNDYGQLGRGTNNNEPNPASAAIASDLRFTSLAKGMAHYTCGIAVTGGAWCWGVNQFKSLGAPTTEKCQSNPSRFYGDLCATRPIRALPDLALDSVTVGDLHGCARVSSGEWTCWGNATNGNLGIGQPQDCVTTVDGIEYHEPCNRDRLPVIGSASFTEMHAGSGMTCAIDLDQRAWCWGGPAPYGSLGTGVFEQASDVPLPVAGDVLFTQLSVGGYNVCGLDASGVAWCWGYARSGAIGNGSFQEAPVDVPTRVIARGK